MGKSEKPPVSAELLKSFEDLGEAEITKLMNSLSNADRVTLAKELKMWIEELPENLEENSGLLDLIKKANENSGVNLLEIKLTQDILKTNKVLIEQSCTFLPNVQ